MREAQETIDNIYTGLAIEGLNPTEQQNDIIAQRERERDHHQDQMHKWLRLLVTNPDENWPTKLHILRRLERMRVRLDSLLSVEAEDPLSRAPSSFTSPDAVEHYIARRHHRLLERIEHANVKLEGLSRQESTALNSAQLWEERTLFDIQSRLDEFQRKSDLEYQAIVRSAQDGLEQGVSRAPKLEVERNFLIDERRMLLGKRMSLERRMSEVCLGYV